MDSQSSLLPYLQLFRGREDYFAQQGEDRYFPVPGTLDEYYLRRHLDGDATFGLYVLNRESCCHFVCIDIDIPRSDLIAVDFRRPDAKYNYLKYKLGAVIEELSFGEELLLREQFAIRVSERGNNTASRYSPCSAR
jgi:hypothetical protein